MPCPICTSRRVTLFHTVDRVPFMQNIRCDSPEAALGVPHGALAMTGCEECGFVWNDAFDPALMRYDSRYENEQGHSPAFASHLGDRLADVVLAAKGIADPLVVEVGCGQGSFLRDLAERMPGTFAGFDPAWRGTGTGQANVRLSSAYYDHATASALGRSPDILISRHTIEHIPAPLPFVRALHGSSATPPRRVFLETPCVDWIIRNGQVQDFFYEHCSLFTAGSLALALTQAGFRSPAVRHVFGGQYLWAGAPESGPAAGMTIPDFASWQDSHGAYLAHWRAELSGESRIILWGAGSKGVLFALILRALGIEVEVVVDINPKKQRAFLPLTAIPVEAPSRDRLDGAAIIIMNPMYEPEIRRSIDAMRLESRVLVLR